MQKQEFNPVNPTYNTSAVFVQLDCTFKEHAIDAF